MGKFQVDIGRQFKIVAVSVTIVVAALAYIGYTYLSSAHAEVTSISHIQTGQGTTTDESEHYSSVLRKYNKVNAKEAEQDGNSYVSAMSSRAEHVAPTEGPVAPATPNEAPSSAPAAGPAAPATPPPPPPPATASPKPNERLSEQIMTLAANWTPVPHTLARTTALEAAAATSPASPEVMPTGAARETDHVEKIVPAFYVAPAILGTAIDTDEDSWISSKIAAGDYEGAILHAPGYKRVNNSVDMTFTFMEWRGHTYHVTAKAVDQESMRTALSGEVNNRYFSRVLLPALALGLGKVGELFQAADTQTTVTPLGAIIQTRNDTPSARTIAGTILGGTATETGQVLKSEAAHTPTKQVLIPLRETIGIQFIESVFSTDDIDHKRAAGQALPSERRPVPPLVPARIPPQGRPEKPPSEDDGSRHRDQ
ncbi:conjugal transfer protein TraO [Rugamonas apoptosis]|uniref:Conjugal transfer protein TraO n=1 Tax=Rugamonas apoptosis TaxID=2758570 RepID=A0A7W2IN82_9BURK|nr:conjugal transfer protein TraO [Rugamonas apoptosis]MBA5690555.1 conjugal transfer protein TraO [Rugamonas apoptosis]